VRGDGLVGRALNPSRVGHAARGVHHRAESAPRARVWYRPRVRRGLEAVLPGLWAGLYVTVAVALGGAAGGAGRARAQEAQGTRSQGAATSPGGGPALAGAHALPALLRLPVAGAAAPGVDVAASGAYGLTEAVLGDADIHHRFGGVLAGAVRVTPWLALGARVEGRVDRHVGASGRDSGALGDLALSARVDHDLSAAFALGAQLGLRIPGREAPSLAPDASTVDLSLAAAWRPSPAVTLAALAGFRLDGSARALAPGTTLSPPDRLALGASDSNAALAGLGAQVRAGAAELFGEVTGDLLVGAVAPPLGQSPWRAAVGGRLPLATVGAGTLTAGVHAEVALSARPGDPQSAPRFPIEPRFSAGLTLAWRLAAFGAARPAPATGGSDAGDGGARGADGGPDSGGAAGDAAGGAGGAGGDAGGDGADTAVEPETVGAATGTSGAVRGVVRTRRGGPVARARVRLRPGDLEARTDAQGAFELEVAPGPYEVVIEADGLRAQRRRVQVEERGVTVLNVELRESR
jgi:hypothetical protein